MEPLRKGQEAGVKGTKRTEKVRRLSEALELRTQLVSKVIVDNNNTGPV